MRCKSFSAKEPQIIGLFSGQWPTKIRHPIHLHRPACKPEYTDASTYIFLYIFLYMSPPLPLLLPLHLSLPLPLLPATENISTICVSLDRHRISHLILKFHYEYGTFKKKKSVDMENISSPTKLSFKNFTMNTIRSKKKIVQHGKYPLLPVNMESIFSYQIVPQKFCCDYGTFKKKNQSTWKIFSRAKLSRNPLQ